jgi:hypothetical protein
MRRFIDFMPIAHPHCLFGDCASVLACACATFSVISHIANPSEGWIERNTFAGLTNHDDIVARSLAIIEGYLTASGAFICGSVPTLADLSCYEELGQNQPAFANVVDYADFPAIRRWLVAMETALPEWEAAHTIFREIGDAGKVNGGMRTIARANRAAASAIERAVAAMPTQPKL